jgi:glycine/D-amino acid oxidase-like deaminating enzyme
MVGLSAAWSLRVGELPGAERLHVAAGFSGYDFVHAPALGEEIARAMLGEEPDVDIARLDPGRFEAGVAEESHVC